MSTPKASKNVVKLDHYTVLVGKEEGIATLGNSLAVFYKIKHTTTIQPSNDTPRS